MEGGGRGSKARKGNFLPSPPPSREKCLKPAENPTETLATQAKGKRIMF